MKTITIEPAVLAALLDVAAAAIESQANERSGDADTEERHASVLSLRVAAAEARVLKTALQNVISLGWSHGGSGRSIEIGYWGGP